ncbi:MAG: glycosyltransferase family 39 protein [Clostridium sp.]|nr:glycosyltransferase family 39 protein [Clostridium sp.]
MGHLKRNYYKLITVVGLLLSTLWIVFINTVPFSDFSYYNIIAKQVANGGVWGNTYTSVGYSIVLGFIYKLFGASIMTAKIFNIFLTFLSYVFLYNILRRIDIKEGRRKLIYALFVLYPCNIFYNSLVGTEIIFTTLFLLITLIYLSDLRFKYVFIGILVGLDAMVKPFFMVFFFAIFLMELVCKRKFIAALKPAAVVLLLSLIVIAPWCYRNTVFEGQVTGISNNGGIVLYINNNSQNNIGRWMDASKVENSIVNTKAYQKANMTKKNKMLSAAAKKWIISHPKEFLVLGCKRFVNTYFGPEDIVFTYNGAGISSGAENRMLYIYMIIKYIITIPAIILIVINSVKLILDIIYRNKIKKFELYGIICFFMLACTYFATEGQGRYSFPVIFVLIYFFSWLFNWAFKEQRFGHERINVLSMERSYLK